MGLTSGVAINEGVALLEQLSPATLNDLRLKHPILSHALSLGIDAGGEEESGDKKEDPLLCEKAEVMVAVLTTARMTADGVLSAASRNIRAARKQRLASQALVLIGSSSSLATLALSQDRAAVIAAVFTLLASLGNLAAEYREKLLNPQAGNIYDLFQKVGESAFKAGTLAIEIKLALKYHNIPELTGLVAQANTLCEQLNAWFVQLMVSFKPGQVT